MLFPSKMFRASIIIYKDYLKEVVDALHEKGLMQIIKIEGTGDAEDEEIRKCKFYEEKISKLISVLRKYRSSKKGLGALLSPEIPKKREVRKRELKELLLEADDFIKGLEEKVLKLDHDVSSLEEEIKEKETYISRLTYLLDLDIDLSYIGETKHTITKVGITDKMDIVKREIEGIGGFIGGKILDKKKDQWLVIASAHLSDKEKFESVWRSWVSELTLPKLSGKVSEVINNLSIERKHLISKLKRIKTALRKLADKHIYDLLALKEEIEIEMARREALSNFGRTKFTYIIEGWVLGKKSNDLKNLLEDITKGNCSIRFSNPSSNPEEPPTHIEAPSPIRPFKPILKLFGLPKYNEINPLLFLAIWFPLMFGFMLGDAGYGMVLLISSIFARLKWRRSSLIRSWSIILALFGFWSIVFGFLSNSFFGDLLPRYFGLSLPSFQFGGLKLPIDGLRNPIFWLQFSLYVGLIHLNIGIALAIVQNLRSGKFKELLTGQVSLIFLQLFGGALIGEHLLKIWKLSPSFETISYFGSIMGIILLALKEKGMTFLELMGFVGDWLSYARLLALGLATTGMAVAFNIVAQLLGNLTNVILSIIILIIAHPVTLGLNSIGAAVHSLRLQYVEFFNRFYEGGGREFAPFQARRRYTKLVEV